jgi:hypothetical protein
MAAVPSPAQLLQRQASPVLGVAPDGTGRHRRRSLLVPLSTQAVLEGHPLAYSLVLLSASGLQLPSYAMTCLPTTIHADHLQGPLSRLH